MKKVHLEIETNAAEDYQMIDHVSHCTYISFSAEGLLRDLVKILTREDVDALAGLLRSTQTMLEKITKQANTTNFLDTVQADKEYKK